ncbi:MAG: hypothetical protein AAGI89_13660 [Pseudomonadota bacterium]
MREVAHVPGESREILQALHGAEEAAWHKIDVPVTYRLEEGGPLIISVSSDETYADSHRLIAPGHALMVEPGAARTLTCLGAAVLFHITLTPDIGLTDRRLMPDDWFPPGGATPRTKRDG